MTQILEKIIDMNLFGSVAIIAVIILRLLFGKVPKKITVWFWLVPAVRLLCPVNFSSALSIFNYSKAASVKTAARKVPSVVNKKVFDHVIVNNPVKQTVSNTQHISTDKISSVQTESFLPDMNTILLVIWITGMTVLALLIIIRSIRMVRKLGLKEMEGTAGVYELKDITTSFVIGLFKPKICIPANVKGFEREYILAHERTHVKNKDQLIKSIMLIILCIHWFNPLVWIMYRLLVTDIEMRCDEAVIDMFGDRIKKDYCVSLVMNATEGINNIAVLDSAFARKTIGGMEIKMRITNLLKYKKIPALAAALCLAIAIGSVWILTSNASKDKEKTSKSETTVETTKKKTKKKAKNVKAVSEEKSEEKKSRVLESLKQISDDNEIEVHNDVPEKVDKIISLDPDITDTIVNLEAADKLIGVGGYGVSNYGCYKYDFSKNLTVFIDARSAVLASPDIVFFEANETGNAPYDEIVDQLIDAGICVIGIPPCKRINHVTEDLRLIGEIVGKSEETEKIAGNFEGRISSIKYTGAEIKDKKKVCFFKAEYTNGYADLESGTLFGEIAELIGAEAVLSTEEYLVDDEYAKFLLDNDPDVIIYEDIVDFTEHRVSENKKYNNIKAVKNHSFAYVGGDELRSTNPYRFVSAIEDMAKQLYLEEYREILDYDMKERNF